MFEEGYFGGRVRMGPVKHNQLRLIYETVITSGISFYIHRKIRFFHKFPNTADPNPNFTISWKLGRTSGELGL